MRVLYFTLFILFTIIFFEVQSYKKIATYTIAFFRCHHIKKDAKYCVSTLERKTGLKPATLSLEG